VTQDAPPSPTSSELSTQGGLRLALEDEIGAGAFGRVVRGRALAAWGDLKQGDVVAVKLLHAKLERDSSALRSLRGEIEAGRHAHHASLVRHFDHGSDGSREFFAMELVEGESLRELFERSGSLPEPQLRSIAAQVCGALAALHDAGYVHADVKPDNIRITPRGRVVLMDLGFARRFESAPPPPIRRVTSRTAAEPSEQARPAPELAAIEGVNPGSLSYLSPERALGQQASPAADVFALALVIYELATGWHPFADSMERVGDSFTASGFSSGRPLRRSLEAPGADQLLAAIVSARYVPPSRLAPGLSPFLDAVLQQALARAPEKRPSAGELRERFVQGELGEWWRAQLDFSSSARRATRGEQDAEHLTPLVGRDAELEQLLDACREAYASDGGAAAAHGGRAVWLIGPAGSGKSRLTSECALRARRVFTPPPLYLYGRCAAFEDQRPSMPILRWLERFLRLPSGAAPDQHQRAALASLVAPNVAATLWDALDPNFAGATQNAVPEALAAWLSALALAQPLLLFLDDVNFADEGTLAVLSRFAADLPRRRAVLVLGQREDEEVQSERTLAALRERLVASGAGLRVELQPLDEDAVESIVNAVFHPSAPRRRLAQILHARSHGNPGQLGEILRLASERGDVHPSSRSDPRWRLSVPAERLPLSESLQASIQERVAKLSEHDRDWLQRLAVVGGRIEVGLLARTFAETSVSEIEAQLAALAQRGWLTPIGDRYRFARPALREALYRSLEAERRRELHSLAADALLVDRTPGAQRRLPLADAVQRAYHLRSAARHADLLRVLRPLVAALLRRGQAQRVYVLSRWGLEALAKLAPSRQRNRQRIEFLEAAADAADRLGVRAEQRRWLDELSDLEFDPAKDPDALSRVYLLHGRYAAGTGQYGLARGMYKNAVELAQRAESAELESEALRRLGAVQAHVGELESAREHLTRARDLAVHEPQRAVALVQLGVVELLENKLEAALACVDTALRLQRRARRYQLPGITAAGHMLRGRIYRIFGRPARALGSMERAVQLARQAGERRLEMEATARLGGLLLDLNRPEDAESRLREALLIAGEIEDLRGQTLASLWLGTLLWEQGDLTSASVLDRASRLASEMGLKRAEALAYSIRSRIAREKGELERALEWTEHAEGLIEHQGAELFDRIVVSGTRALVLHTAGRADEAAEIVRALERRMRRDNDSIGDDSLKRSHGEAMRRLLDAVLSPVGVIYPRVTDDAGPSPIG
jgi:serine/threonine protein kinase/tetratricopeptide (TPR) repeat protein